MKLLDLIEQLGGGLGRLLTVTFSPLLDWMRQSYLKVGNATVFTWITVGFLFCATFGAVGWLRVESERPLLEAQASSERALTEWRLINNDEKRAANATANIKRLRIEIANAEKSGDNVSITAVGQNVVKFYALAYRDQAQNPPKILREFTASPFSFPIADVPGTGDIIVELRAEFEGGVTIRHRALLYVPVGE